MADMLSQDEIDALLGGGGSSSDSASGSAAGLTNDEKDALGEVGNISMGTAATTLFTLLGQKVTITTPQVFETTLEEMAQNFISPCVVITIHYKVGIQGLNLLILNENDVKIITDLMMGNDGTNVPDELTDLHLSAISEAMNQMIGSSSTSLSEMINSKVDISPPEAVYTDIASLDIDNLGIDRNEPLVKISFKMTVGDLIDSEIMQVIPVAVAKQLVQNLLNTSNAMIEEVSGGFDEPKKESAPQAQPAPQMQQAPQQPQYYEQSPSQVPNQAPPGNYNYAPQRQQAPVNAQPFQFDSFDSSSAGMIAYASDIDIIKDVPLEITVELGRTRKKISEILDFGVGSVIELDRLVGESLDIMANGKRIAKGEVVVVDECYGIRLTEIIVPDKRT